ncbi:MAG TPA: M28 family peptidase [Thermoanaerobaculia bacterium]
MRPVVRILSATAASLAVLFGAAAVLITQPTFGDLPPLADTRADPRRLRQDVEVLTSTSPRDSDHPQNLDRAAAYIREQLSKTGGRVGEQAFEVRGHVYRNVLASFGPEDGPVVVVGAHYDSFGDFGENPGADDNASGTAGLLELARLLGGHRLGRKVELVAFSTEEPPFFASPWMGSAVHARSLAGQRVRAMICLEMIGYFTEEQPWPHWSLRALYPDRGDFIAVVGRWSDRGLARQVKRAMRGAGGVPVHSFTVPRSADIDASDQRNYWDAGFPAVMVTDTAFLRNPHYHSPGDTADTLDYPRMAGVVDGVLNAVLHAAELPAGSSVSRR